MLDLNPYIGHPSQLAGCYRFVYDDGLLKGTQAVEVYNETGLRFTVLLGRGMDISYAWINGQSLVHVGKSGFTSAAYFQNGGNEWNRAFGAGLITTCGLDNVGPGLDEGRQIYGNHGLFSSLTAEQAAVERRFIGDEECIEIRGLIRQAAIFGESFAVHRCIRTYIKKNTIELEDKLINESFEPRPLFLMYHCNFGYPLLSEKSRLDFNAEETVARDEDAAKSLADFKKILPPTQGFREQVFYHTGVGKVTLTNYKISVVMSWDKQALPCFTQWNMFGEGDYVLGLEPGNCNPRGRQELLKSNQAEYLEPGQVKKTFLRFDVITQSI